MTTAQAEAAPLPTAIPSRFDLARLKEDLSVRGYALMPELMPRDHALRIGARMRELMRRDPEFDRKNYVNLHGVFDSLETMEDIELFVPLVDNPVVLALARAQLGEDLQMSCTGGVCFKPGARNGFQWHIDVPLDWFTRNGKPLPDFCMALNALWLLSDFTREGGATRVVPFSHRSRRTPVGMRIDADGYQHLDHELSIEAPAGSCLLFDHALWHAAGDNSSARERLHISNPYYPNWIDGGNVMWTPINRRIYDMLPPHVQQMHRHTTDDLTTTPPSAFRGH